MEVAGVDEDEVVGEGEVVGVTIVCGAGNTAVVSGLTGAVVLAIKERGQHGEIRMTRWAYHQWREQQTSREYPRRQSEVLGWPWQQC